MSRKRMELSCNKPKDDVHSSAGVDGLRKSIKNGLTKKYIGIVESMWEWEFPDPQFEDMVRMSAGTAPEKTLYQNGMGVWFELAGQIHFLQVGIEGGLNIYGKPTAWYAIPVGWDVMKRGQNRIADQIRDRILTEEDSVLMRNDLTGSVAKDFVDAMVNELVDNLMTLNQLQLLAKSPYVFRVTEDNLMSAKNFFQALASDKPAIFTNTYGEDVTPVVEMTGSKIDPALLELFDRWECQLLEYFGIECVPITKRAQQTVSEVQSNSAKLRIRRLEMLRQRQLAVDLLNEKFGTNVKVSSVIDDMVEEAEQQDRMMDDNGNIQDKEESE